MPLTQEQQDNIHSFLTDKGEEDGTRLAPDTFPGLLFKYWDDVTNPQRMFRQAKRRRLRQLKGERDRIAVDGPAMDAEIAALEAEVGP
jgi:hypothetical protein